MSEHKIPSDTDSHQTMAAIVADAQEKLYADEIKRLGAMNAELLAALENIVQHQLVIAGELVEFGVVSNIAKAAIKKASSGNP